MTEQALNGIGNLGRQAAIAYGPRDGLLPSDRAPQAEVVGVEHALADLHLLALNADVGDPVLAATVGAPRDVQLQVLLEAGQALLQFLDQPASKALGFGDGNLAELGSAAGDH